MSEQSDNATYRTIDRATIKEADVYERDNVGLEFELEIADDKISGPFASDYELLVEILTYFEQPVTEAGVENLEGREIPVALDAYSEDWIAVDTGVIRERIDLGRVDR